jgi:CubicO group peptidase (beta-lactamase class C family)
MSRILTGLLVALTFLSSARAEESEEIQKLRAEVETILRETHTPAAGVAVVRDRKIEWVAGIGLADIASGRRASEETLFRIGSVSKGFVGLAALKLQEEGRLDLNAPLAALAPELAGDNPWEATDPVRFVHLLEHTSGWDDEPTKAGAWEGPNEVPLAEGLALVRSAQKCRWKPGTRYAYSNVGPAVAAAVIEKITGERFEDYVQRTWFGPLGMRDSTYFGSPEVQQRLATGYRRDGRTPFPYWKLVIRPSGAINASPRDLANYVLFHVQRGHWNGATLLSEASFARLEQPTSTHAARQGLSTGYGLGNGAAVRRGWLFRGHSGMLMGGRTEFAYLPDEGAGYAFAITTENGSAFMRLSRALEAHVTRHLAKPPVPAIVPVPAALMHFEGWYESINPRTELARGLERWLTLTRVHVLPDAIEVRHLGNNNAGRWLHCGQGLFRRAEDPVPTTALIATADEGLLLQGGEMPDALYRRISTGTLRLRTSLGATTVGLLLSVAAFAFIWIPRWLLRRLEFRGTLKLRLFPLLASVSVFAIGVFFFIAAVNAPAAIYRFGRLTPWSGGLFVCSLLVPFFSVTGLVEAWRLRRYPMNRFLRWHCIAGSLAGVVASLYLADAGWLALRTWS